MNKKIISFVCVCVLTMSLLPLTAFAEEAATPKNETVYVNLDNNGKATQINVVNMFDVSSGEAIYDYGNYTEAKNLTDTSKITVDGERISAVSGEDTFYYQGKMKQTELPWDISVHYFLDGNELTADEIAGKNGKFELRIGIKAGNERYKEFFEQYMMQISLTLDKDLFTSIKTDNGTVNVVGRTASISYTHAMNTEAEYVLKADVTDFEMGAIQIQAASIGDMGLDLDNELLGDFDGEFEELTNATSMLSESAGKIADGSDAFYSGIWSMDSQAKELSNGVSNLYSSSNALSNGADDFGAGLSQFSSALTDLSAASQEITQTLEYIKEQTSAVPVPNDALVAYAQTLVSGDDPNLSALAQSYLAQNEAIAQLTSVINQIDTACTQFNTTLQGGADISALISNYAQIQDGVAELNAAVGQLNSSVSGTLVPGVSAMLSSYAQLNDGTKRLSEAMDEFDKNAAEIPHTFEEKIDEIIPSEPTKLSFVSEKNSADSVLFIMRTNAIDVSSTIGDEVLPAREPVTFWEKLLNLFGLWNS